MFNINNLHEKLQDSPTILEINDEIFFIENLQKLPVSEICENKELFAEILAAIQISHQDNGIFEVDNENIELFFNFVIWLRYLKEKYHIDCEKYIDGLDTNFDGTIQI